MTVDRALSFTFSPTLQQLNLEAGLSQSQEVKKRLPVKSYRINGSFMLSTNVYSFGGERVKKGVFSSFLFFRHRFTGEAGRYSVPLEYGSTLPVLTEKGLSLPFKNSVYFDLYFLQSLAHQASTL